MYDYKEILDNIKEAKDLLRTNGLGSLWAKNTRFMPEAIMASVQGGVLPYIGFRVAERNPECIVCGNKFLSLCGICHLVSQAICGIEQS